MISWLLSRLRCIQTRKTPKGSKLTRQVLNDYGISAVLKKNPTFLFDLHVWLNKSTNLSALQTLNGIDLMVALIADGVKFD